MTNNGTVAGDLAPLNRLIAKLVVKSVIHARQVRQPGASGGISAIQRERPGIVDQHEFPTIGYEAMEGSDENITCLLVNGVRQNHSCTLRLSPKRTEKLGVMNRNHMKSFFASGVKPHRDFRIGKTGAVGNQQEQAVGSGARAVVGCPRPCDQGPENQATGRQDDSCARHWVATTCP